MAALKLVGNVYNKLTVTSRADNHIAKGGRISSAFNCLCECGTEKVVSGDNLKRGHIQSCGCLNKVSKSVKLARAQTKLDKAQEARDAAKALKAKTSMASLEDDVSEGLCKPLDECNQYYLYRDGRLFSLRSLAFLLPDWNHGDYKQTTVGLLQVRRTPCYTIVLDNDVSGSGEDTGKSRFTIASLLLKTFDRQPTVGERAWRKDWLRNPKKRPELHELEWVSALEHGERVSVLKGISHMTKPQRRKAMRKIEHDTLVATLESQRMMSDWHDSERCYM